MVKTSDDNATNGLTSAPGVAAAEALAKEIISAEDKSLGRGLATSAKLAGSAVMGETDTHVSVDQRTGQPGGKEGLPSVEPGSVTPANVSDNNKIWEDRIKAGGLGVTKRGK